MPGRTPKPKSQRVRDRKTMGETFARNNPGVKPPVLPGSKDLCVAARNYWKTIWSSPMAPVYLDADVPALVRLTELVHVWSLLRENAVLAEIRQMEDRFGLSPLARRKLEWEITQASPDKQAEDPATSAEDERWLKAVK